MDFLGEPSKSKGFDTILVVVSRLTKYVHFLPLQHPFTVKKVTNLCAKEILKLHDYANSIISERNKIFISHF